MMDNVQKSLIVLNGKIFEFVHLYINLLLFFYFSTDVKQLFGYHCALKGATKMHTKVGGGASEWTGLHITNYQPILEYNVVLQVCDNGLLICL